MNLKRDLPHIPTLLTNQRYEARMGFPALIKGAEIANDFWGFANAGAQLADLHVNYESVPKV